MTTSLRTLTLLAVACLPAACGDSGAKPNDGGAGGSGGAGARDAGKPDGPIDAMKVDAPTELTELTVQGKVTPGTNVTVTARCGDNPESMAMADDTGKYTITANVADCREPLVVKFTKESYLPNLRVIKLPPPKTPLELNVPLKELSMLLCGTRQCRSTALNFDIADFPAAARGWTVAIVGTSGADYFGGEMRDLRGRIAFLFGFGYLDAYDQAGLPATPPVPIAQLFRVSGTELLNVGDIKPTTDFVEMAWFKLVEAIGRWQLLDSVAHLYFLYPCSQVKECYPPTKFQGLELHDDPDPDPMSHKRVWYVPATRSQIRDIRSNMFRYDCKQDMLRPMPSGIPGVDSTCTMPGTGGAGGAGGTGGMGAGGIGGNPGTAVSQFYVAGPVTGNGFFAFGTTVDQRMCYEVTAKDTCGTPVPGALLVGKGRYQPYRVEAYTNTEGKACIEGVASEPTCTTPEPDLMCDFNQNLLGGEKFWLSLNMSAPSLSPQLTLTNRENPLTMGDCDQPDTCEKIEHTFIRTRCN